MTQGLKRRGLGSAVGPRGRIIIYEGAEGDAAYRPNMPAYRVPCAVRRVPCAPLSVVPVSLCRPGKPTDCILRRDVTRQECVLAFAAAFGIAAARPLHPGSNR